jgi:hypothetical protein
MTTDDLIPFLEQAGICQEVWFEHHKSIERLAALVAAEKEQQMIRDGYRKCAEGQRTTQFCGLLDAAVKAEREACAKLCEKEQFELTQDVSGKNGLQHFDAGCRSCAEMIRARGEV